MQLGGMTVAKSIYRNDNIVVMNHYLPTEGSLQ